MDSKEGWGFVDTLTGGSRKAHFFEDTGRSLCDGWLALGTPRWLINQWPLQRVERAHCARCWREYWKDYQNKALAEAATS